MFVLKNILFAFFGWVMMLGTGEVTTLPGSMYVPEDRITASDEPEQIPLFFDAIFDVNQTSTYETSIAKTFSQTDKGAQIVAPSLFYELSYYNIGRQIVVALSVKTIIFPFHCFT